MGGTGDMGVKGVKDEMEEMVSVEGEGTCQAGGQTQHFTWVESNQTDSRGKASNATLEP